MPEILPCPAIQLLPNQQVGVTLRTGGGPIMTPVATSPEQGILCQWKMTPSSYSPTGLVEAWFAPEQLFLLSDLQAK